MKGYIFLRSFKAELARFIPLEAFDFLLECIEHLGKNGQVFTLAQARAGFSVVFCHVRDSHASQNDPSQINEEELCVRAWKTLSAKRVARSLLAVSASQYTKIPRGDVWITDEILHQRLYCIFGFFFAQACPGEQVESHHGLMTADHRHGALMLRSMQNLGDHRWDRLLEVVNRQRTRRKGGRLVGYLIELLGGVESPPNTFDFDKFVTHVENPGRAN